METLYLGYNTARWYWEHAFDTAVDPHDLPVTSSFAGCMRGAESVREAVRGTVFARQPLDVLVPRGSHGTAENVVFHGCSGPFPRRAFTQVAPGILLASPELSFLQTRRNATFVDTLLYGYALCGNFALDEDSPTGLVNRNSPLTTPRRLENFANACTHMNGARIAKTRARYVRAGSASPRESKLSLLTTLPLQYGGKGLPAAQLNKKIPIPARYKWSGGRNYYVADLYWENAKVTVEYDSDLAHANKQGIWRDSDKRNTLTDMGYTPLCFTSIQLDDPRAFDHAAEALRRALDVRRRPLPKDYQRKVDQLRSELGLSTLPFTGRLVDGPSWDDPSWW